MPIFLETPTALSSYTLHNDHANLQLMWSLQKSRLGLPHACCHKGIFLRLSDDTPPRSQPSWRFGFFQNMTLSMLFARNKIKEFPWEFATISCDWRWKTILLLSFIAWNSGWQLEEWPNRVTNLEILKFKNHKHQTLIVVILRYLQPKMNLFIMYLTYWT